MYLGIELYAESLIGISVGTFFKTTLLVDNIEHSEFSGYDFFDLNTVILKDKRVSASGRKCINSLASLPAGLGTLNITAAKPVFIEKNSINKYQIVLETDLFKDPEVLKEKISIKLISLNSAFPIIPLNSTWLNIEQTDGKHTIDITKLVHDFAKKIS